MDLRQQSDVCGYIRSSDDLAFSEAHSYLDSFACAVTPFIEFTIYSMKNIRKRASVCESGLNFLRQNVIVSRGRRLVG